MLTRSQMQAVDEARAETLVMVAPMLCDMTVDPSVLYDMVMLEINTHEALHPLFLGRALYPCRNCYAWYFNQEEVDSCLCLW